MLEDIMDLQSKCMLAENEISKKKPKNEIKEVIDETINELNLLFKKSLGRGAYNLNVKLSYLQKNEK